MYFSTILIEYLFTFLFVDLVYSMINNKSNIFWYLTKCVRVFQQMKWTTSQEKIDFKKYLQDITARML